MSKEVNYSGSINDVVNTVGPVLKVIIDDVIRAEIQNCGYVYDPDLTYETAMKRFRNVNQMNNAKVTAPPLFVFKRSPLRYPDDVQSPNKRLIHSKNNLVTGEGSAVTYTCLHAEFDLDFLYISKNMEDIERFEITYLSEEGISGTREVTVNIPELGDFKYFISYNELVDLTVNIDDNFYKAVLSSMKVRGFFFTFRTEAKRILEVNANIRAFYDSIAANELLSTISINS